MSDLISRQDAIEAVATVTMSIHLSNVLCDKLLALPSADAVQIPIKLEKRYPQSRDEDITDAFMRGYLAGRSSADRQGVVRCKDCKYFEYNHTEVVDGVPLILAHEICAFWGGGSKTSENGYCSFGERKEQRDE